MAAITEKVAQFGCWQALGSDQDHLTDDPTGPTVCAGAWQQGSEEVGEK